MDGAVEGGLNGDGPASGDRPPLLPLEPLRDFLAARGLVGDGPLQAGAIGLGHSNPTYLVTQDGVELVVRRPPPGPLPPTAHDVIREARVIAALAGRLPVPRVLAVCDDASVIGAPFFVMEKVDGWVISETLPDDLAGAAEPRRIAEALVDTLAELHAVDWAACGLADFGRPAGYLERQVRRFSQIWDHNKTRELQDVERVGEWLRTRVPRSHGASIVHGDYRLGNAMFARTPPARIVALLDWEMATLGDPLADVGYLAAFWVQPDDRPLRIFELSAAMRAGGFPSRREIVARYEERTGRAAADIRWYEALALWKLAVVMEGNYARARAGRVSNTYLADFKDGVAELAELAAEVASIGTARGG